MTLHNSASVIRESARSGYYINTSVALEDHMLATKEITDPQKNIWRFLYKESRLSKDLSCQVTRAQIAKGAGKCESSIPNMLKAIEAKGYLAIQANDNSINTYFLKLPDYALEKIQQAPKRGEGRDVAVHAIMQPYVENRTTDLKKQVNHHAEEKLSTKGEEKFAYSSNFEQKGWLQNHGGVAPEPRGGGSRTTGGVAPELPLILNINKYNKNNNITHSPTVDNIEPTDKNKSFAANALLNQFHFVLDEISQQHPTLSPLRRNTQALSKFSDDEKMQLHLLITAPEAHVKLSTKPPGETTTHQDTSPSKHAPKPVEANTLEGKAQVEQMQEHHLTAPRPRQQREPTLSQATVNTASKPVEASMDMIEIKLQDEKFLVEKSVQKAAIAEITQAHNFGRINGDAAKKSLGELITEVLFYVCAGNKNKSQVDKCKSAINICKFGTWKTPYNFHNKAIRKRELVSKQAKSTEIRQAKQMFAQMGL